MSDSSLCFPLSSSPLSPPDPFTEHICFHMGLPCIPLLSKAPVFTVCQGLGPWSHLLFWTGVCRHFPECVWDTPEKALPSVYQRLRRHMGKKPVKCCLTQKTPNLPDCGILFLCDTYCLSLESVSYREHALEMLILILSVCVWKPFPVKQRLHCC